MTTHSWFNRLFNILVLAILIVMAWITIQQAASGAEIAEAASALRINPAASLAQCLRMEPHQSITASYVKGMQKWVAYTEAGPAGVDGGLIYLLSLPRCK